MRLATGESNEFHRALLKTLIEGCYSRQTRNTDWRRLGGRFSKRFKASLQESFSSLLHRFGFVDCDYNQRALGFILEHLESFERVYGLLGDEDSRALLLKLLAFKILGPKHIKLPLNTPAFWEKYDSIDEKFCRQKRTASVWNNTWFLKRYEIPSEGGPISLHAHPLTVLGTYFLEQYAYRKGRSGTGLPSQNHSGLPSPAVAAKPGDIIIDGGGCWGDTALYFAEKVGESGKVFSFEFMQENMAIFKMNLALNPMLAPRIELVPEALWNCSGKMLSFDSNGPGSKVGGETGGSSSNTVRTVSIDDYVLRHELPRVDFIKLDIEGAEYQALQGASEPLKKFKPRLAISVYHKEDDLLVIPAWLKELGIGYRFYLDHFTIHSEETVLFATTAPGQG